MERKVSRLAQPSDRQEIERDVPPNNKEHHEMFLKVLRDPSPISPERALELRRSKSRSREMARTNASFVSSNMQSTIGNSISNNKMITRYQRLFEEERAKV